MKLGRRGGGEKDACLSRRLVRQHDPHYFGHEGILSIKKKRITCEAVRSGEMLKKCLQGMPLQTRTRPEFSLERIESQVTEMNGLVSHRFELVCVS